MFLHPRHRRWSFRLTTALPCDQPTRNRGSGQEGRTHYELSCHRIEPRGTERARYPMVTSCKDWADARPTSAASSIVSAQIEGSVEARPSPKWNRARFAQFWLAHNGSYPQVDGLRGWGPRSAAHPSVDDTGDGFSSIISRVSTTINRRRGSTSHKRRPPEIKPPARVWEYSVARQSVRASHATIDSEYGLAATHGSLATPNHRYRLIDHRYPW